MLQPGEVKTFTIKLKPPSQPFSASEQGGVLVQVEFGASYKADGEDRNAAWQLEYVAVPTIWPKPPTLRLGSRSELQAEISKTGLIEATNEIVGVDVVAPPNWSAQVTQVPGTANPRRYEITVRYQGPFTPQRLAEPVRLIPVGRDGARLPGKELKVVGEIVRDVAATPAEVHHGPRPCGTVVEEAVRVSSLTGRRFRVVSITCATADLTATRLPGADEVYSFRQRITTPGDQEAKAKFVVRDEVGAEYAVIVPFRYRGLATPDR